MGGAPFILFRLNLLFAQMVARAFTSLGKVMLVVPARWRRAGRWR